MSTNDLYQEVVLDHYRSPRNFGRPEPADRVRTAEGHNPLCGDQVTMHVALADGRVADVRFEGAGCAISVASASLLTEAVKGKSLDEARALFDRMLAMLTGDDAVDTAALGKLAVFSGVRDYPVRVKCATLAWHTFRAALEERDDPVSTEADVASD